MACRAGTALHRKPERLVEHQHVVIFIKRDRFEELAGLVVGCVTRRTRFRMLEPQRRNAHALPGFEPVLRLGALAVDPQLAFTDDALDVRETQAWKLRFQEAIDPHAGFVGRDGDILDSGRHRGRSRSRHRFPLPVILRWPQSGPRRIRPRYHGPSPFEARLRSHLRVTERVLRFLTLPMSRAGDLLAAARLPWSAFAPHVSLRSRRSFAQYSRRFLISRSKPRSGGS